MRNIIFSSIVVLAIADVGVKIESIKSKSKSVEPSNINYQGIPIIQENTNTSRSFRGHTINENSSGYVPSFLPFIVFSSLLLIFISRLKRIKLNQKVYGSELNGLDEYSMKKYIKSLGLTMSSDKRKVNNQNKYSGNVLNLEDESNSTDGNSGNISVILLSGGKGTRMANSLKHTGRYLNSNVHSSSVESFNEQNATTEMIYNKETIHENIPKQFLTLFNKESSASISFRRFLHNSLVHQIIVVCEKEYEYIFRNIIKEINETLFSENKIKNSTGNYKEIIVPYIEDNGIPPLIGLPSYIIDKPKRFIRVEFASPGESRVDSMMNGAHKLKHRSEDSLVAIHDAARPFFRDDELISLARAASVSGAATLGRPLKDSVKLIEVIPDAITNKLVNSKISELKIKEIKLSQEIPKAKEFKYRILDSIDKTSIWECQTPQVLQWGVIKKAIRILRGNGDMGNKNGDGESEGINNKLKNMITDDVSLVHLVNELYQSEISIDLMEGSDCNIKLTTVSDIETAKACIDANVLDQLGFESKG